MIATVTQLAYERFSGIIDMIRILMGIIASETSARGENKSGVVVVVIGIFG